jgi:DMSO/TMAO reductase YedYZ molybdopterin-dependent catalytic subunit
MPALPLNDSGNGLGSPSGFLSAHIDNGEAGWYRFSIGWRWSMGERLSRRAFLGGLGVGTLGLGFGVSVFPGVSEALEEGTHELLMKGTVNFKGFMAKEITPNGEFYITTYSTTVPDIPEDQFSLRVEGLVETPYALSLRELEGMMDKREFVTLECIGNPVGGDAIGNALWEGVTLRKVIEKASPAKGPEKGPERGIVKTVFYARDGYTDSIPYDLSLSDDVFLAFRMNGEPLPREHGRPVRAIVPGIYVKWLSKIELVNYDFKGYWEKRGWSDQAVIPIKSQILMPMDGKTIPRGHYVIGGIAFAGRHGIERVQISLDDGRSWNDAEVKPPLSRWAWSLWRYDWMPDREGEFTLKVRGIDRAGNVQESASLIGRLLGRTFPDGSKGIHSVNVTVQGQ